MKNNNYRNLPILLLLFTPLAHAEGINTLETVFANFQTSASALTYFVNGASVLIGLLLSVSGLMDFAKYTEGGGRMELKQPIYKVVVGASLLAMRASLGTMTSTMALDHEAGCTLFCTGGTETVGQFSSLAFAGIFSFIKLLGHVSFIKGLLYLKDHGQGKQDALGRGLTHLLGGTACINIESSALILANTFFTGVALPGGMGI